MSGDYFVTVKYNGSNVNGSPFKVQSSGGSSKEGIRSVDFYNSNSEAKQHGSLKHTI